MTPHPLNIVLLLLFSLFAVQVFSAIVHKEDVTRVFKNKQRVVTTVISTFTVTATGATTVTQSTRLVCATLVDPIATTVCRRKRQFWPAPIYIQLGQEDDFQPSQVLRVEPSALPEFRNRPSSAFRPFAPQYPISPFALQPSFGDNSLQIGPALGFRPVVQQRFFRPFGFLPFSSLFSNIISSLLTPAVTSTITQTVYTTTDTFTIYTATVTYTLEAAPCIPPGVIQCPASPITTTTSTETPTTITGRMDGEEEDSLPARNSNGRELSISEQLQLHTNLVAKDEEVLLI